MANENAIERVTPVALADPAAALQVDARIDAILDEEAWDAAKAALLAEARRKK